MKLNPVDLLFKLLKGGRYYKLYRALEAKDVVTIYSELESFGIKL